MVRHDTTRHDTRRTTMAHISKQHKIACKNVPLSLLPHAILYRVWLCMNMRAFAMFKCKLIYDSLHNYKFHICNSPFVFER